MCIRDASKVNTYGGIGLCCLIHKVNEIEFEKSCYGGMGNEMVRRLCLKSAP